MADVFLSYAREDRRLAHQLADRLGEAGFSVWWDRYIPGGADFGAEIEREIKAAKSVIVLWSQVSQSSKWVRDEAACARDENKLVPLRIDDALPPLGFRQVHAIDFSGWKGSLNAEPFEALLQSLGRMLDPGRAGDASSAPPAATNRSPYMLLRVVLRNRRIASGLAAVIVAGAAVAILYLGSPLATRAPDVAFGQIEIRPFAANPPDPERLARAATYADAFRNRFSEMGVRNVSAERSADARTSEFILVGEIARDGDKEVLTVRLDDRSSGSTLWSIRQRPSEGAAWEANVTSYAVKCALRRRDPERGVEMLSRYLYGCASYLDGDFRSFYAAAKDAYEAAPDDPTAIAFFAVGTVAVGYGAAVSRVEHERFLKEGRRLAERALQLDPSNADALFAMGFTFEDPQFSEQERWWRAAVEADPESGMGPGRYGNFLTAVGRIREAMDMELRAAHLRRNTRTGRAARLFAAEGDWRQAQALYDFARPFDPDGVARSELQTYVMYGDIETASRMLADRPDLAGRDRDCWRQVLGARRREPIDAARFADACGGRFDSAVLFTLAGDLDGAHREIDMLLSANEAFEPPHLFGREMDAFRRDPRFWPLVARMGFAAYWLETDQWPDFCAEPDYPVNCRDAAREALAALSLTSSPPRR